MSVSPPAWVSQTPSLPGLHDPTRFNVPGAGMLDAQQWFGTLEALVEYFVGEIAIAFGGIEIFGWKPFAFLQTWGENLQAQAQDAFDGQKTANTNLATLLDGVMGTGHTFEDLATFLSGAASAADAARADITTLLDGVLGAGHTMTDFVTYLAALPITAVSGLGGYLTNLSSSGVLALSGLASGALPGGVTTTITQVSSLPGYLTNLSSAGVLAGVSAVSGLPSYLTNLSTSGVLSLSGLASGSLPAGITAGISQITSLAGYLTNLSPSGILSSTSAVAGLNGYLTHLNTSGVLAGVSFVTGLPGYLTNLSTSGVLALTGLANGALPAGVTAGISQITSLPGYLTNLSSSGVLSGISAVTGLGGYLSNLSSSGVLALAGLASGALPTGVTAGISNVTGLVGYLTNLSSSGVLALSGLASGALPTGITLTGTQVSGALNTALTVSGQAIGGVQSSLATTIHNLFPVTGDPYFGNVVALLHCDGANGSTSFIDSSPQANIFSSINGVALNTAQSKYGSASASFAATNSYLTLTSNTASLAYGTDDFTIECWLYLNGAMAANSALYDARNGGGNQIFWYISGPGQLIYVNLTDSAQIASPVLSFGQWHHVAVCRSSGTVQMFVEGVSAGTVADTNDYAAPSSGLMIGRSAGSGLSLNGYIDELRITKGIARYTSNFAVPTVAFPSKGVTYGDIGTALNTTLTVGGKTLNNVLANLDATGNYLGSLTIGAVTGLDGYLTNLSNGGVLNLSGLASGALPAGITMASSALTGLGAGIGTWLTSSGALPASVTLAATQLASGALAAGVSAAISNVTGLAGYLGHLSSSGVLDAVSSVTGLVGYLTNLSSSGVVALAGLASGALPAGVTAAIGNVTGLAGYLGHLSSSGIVDAVGSVTGLPGYLTNLSSGGVLTLAGLATGSLPAGVTAGISQITSLNGYLTNLNSSGVLALAGLAAGALPSGITLPGSQLTGALNAGLTIGGTALSTLFSGGQIVASQIVGALNTGVTIAGQTVATVQSNAQGIIDAVVQAAQNDAELVNQTAATAQANLASFFSGLTAALSTGNTASPPAASAADAVAAAGAIQERLAIIGNGAEEQVAVDFSTFSNGSLPSEFTVISGSGMSISGGNLVAGPDISSPFGEIVLYNNATALTDYQQVSGVFIAAPTDVVPMLIGRMDGAGDAYVAAIYSVSGFWQLWFQASGSGSQATTFDDVFTPGATYTLACGNPAGSAPRQYAVLKNGTPLNPGWYVESGTSSQLGGGFRGCGIGSRGSSGASYSMSSFAFQDTIQSSPSVLVTTSESTTSTAYTNLATVSDEVAVNVGARGMVDVKLLSKIHESASTAEGFMGFAMSGANSSPASDDLAIMYQAFTSNAEGQIGASFLLTGLSPGLTVFKAKYRCTSGTATFSNRRIGVVAL